MCKKIIIYFLLLLVGFLLGNFYHLTKTITKPVNLSDIVNVGTENCESSDIKECKAFPWLDLPMNYFSINDVQWGSAGNGNGDKITDYTEVALDNKTIYQSYPTTNTTIKKYFNESISFQVKTYTEIKNQLLESWPEGPDFTQIKENYERYGSLASNYLPDTFIQWDNSFDADGDGIKEKIVMLNDTYAADAGSYHADIIKNGEIIFSVNEDNSSIVPADTSNGFYIEWRNPNDESARCCEIGFLRTRFVYENGEFRPLYEQEVRYLIIGNRK